MSIKTPSVEMRTDTRTRRACEGCMIVVPRRGGTGQFEVYSANDGVNKIYEVDLRAEACECPDYEHRGVECKHIKRVKLGLGILPVPAGVELDEALVHDRRKYGVVPEITRHVEPPEQGGETYYRCEACGWESLRKRDLTSEYHREECTHQ